MNRYTTMIFVPIIIIMIHIICFPLLASQDVFSGGSGTEQDPYQVETAEQLDEVRNYPDKHFIQTADIDLGVSPWNDGSGWLPIGVYVAGSDDYDQLFSGSYNGNDFTISNLTINRPGTNYIGLFGLTYHASLTNTRLENVNITGAHYVGALIAMTMSDCVITFSSSSGTVRSVGPGIGTDYVHWTGGLIGQINGTVTDSYSTADVNGSGSVVGGFAGQANSGSLVERSYSTGSAHGTKFIGGFVGHVNPGTIRNCYTTASVSGSNHIGGFTGWNRGQIINSYAVGGVSATSTLYIGGFIARVYLGSDSGNYWDTQTTGSTSSAGSALGRTTQDMTYPYGSNTFVGWDFDETWQADINGTENGGYPYLQMQNGQAIPSFEYAGGSGTEEDPFQVETAEQLNQVRNYPDKHFIQIADIDLGGTPWNDAEGWLPVGNTVDIFSGTYDAQNFLIDNLYIDRPDEDGIGLFGTVSGTVSNLRVKGSVIGRNYTGGVVGWLAGDNSTKPAVLENVVFDGSVTGNLQVGGIAGILYKDGEIRSCVSMGAVTSVSDGSGAGHGVGGITGYGGGVYGHTLVESCYSTAIVTGTAIGNSIYQGAGGIIGYVGGGRETKNCWFGGVVTGGVVKGGIVGGLTEGARVTNCYSYGTVTESGTHVGGIVGRLSSGTVTNSYFDTEVSGQINCAGGIGRSTEEMTYPYASDTYVNWNFDEIWQEDTNGTLNGGYPLLIRQHVTLEPMYVLTLHTTPEDGGTVSGSGSYKDGAKVMLFAVPADGFEFINWMMNGNILLNGEDPAGATFEFHMPAGDVVITAIFSGLTAVTPFMTGIPNEFVLYQNYPNPFNPSTVIRYGLPERSYVRLAVFNNVGQKVSELINKEQDAGYYEVEFDAESLSSGIYIYRMQAGEYVINKKFILLK